MRALAVCGCFLIGALSLAVLPEIHRKHQEHYSVTEGHFVYPVPLRAGTAILRRDSEGKGHYGASRSNDRKHEGIDLWVPLRMPVYAAKSGRVSVSGPGKGYGKYVELLHPDGRVTRYAHLSYTCVLEGDWAEQGRVVGVSGKTGNASGRRVHPHLHFEIRQEGRPLDPGPLMDKSVLLK